MAAGTTGIVVSLLRAGTGSTVSGGGLGLGVGEGLGDGLGDGEGVGVGADDDESPHPDRSRIAEQLASQVPIFGLFTSRIPIFAAKCVQNAFHFNLLQGGAQ